MDSIKCKYAECRDCAYAGDATISLTCAQCVDAGMFIPTLRAIPAKQVNDVDAVLAERGSRYGRFIDHASITQDLKSSLLNHAKKHGRELEVDQLEALEMICHKLGRIVNGDPNYADSWIDIAGYAKLVADRLEGKVV